MKIDLHRICKVAIFSGVDRTPPYPIQWTNDHTAKFSTRESDPQLYVIEFEIDVEGKFTSISFFNASHPTISYGVTGTGNPIKVFETVVHAILQFHKDNVEELFAHKFSFTASTTELFELEPGKYDKRPTKRVEFYRKLIQRFLPNWKVEEDSHSHSVFFTVTSPEFDSLSELLGVRH